MSENSNLPSTEVIGQFTEPQKAELSILAGTIMEARNMDFTSDDEKIEALTVVADCVKRSLWRAGKTWMGSTDEIATLFNEGLEDRRKVVKELKDFVIYGGKGETVRFPEFSSDQENYVRELSPLATDFSQADELHSVFTEGKKNIRKLHSALFSNPDLAEDADKLRKEVKSQDLGTTDTEINNRLYANLLVHATIYQRAGLIIEPKDIAFLKSLWEGKEARGFGEEKIINAIKPLAENTDVPQGTIEEYTRIVLEAIQGEIEHYNNDLEQIERSDKLIVTSESIEEESKEFIKPKSESVYQVTSVEAEIARSKYKKFEDLIIQHHKAVEKDQDKKAEETAKEYLDMLRTITPYELIRFLQSIKSSVESSKVIKTYEFDYEEDIMATVQKRVIVESLDVLYADRVVTEKNESVFDNESDKLAGEVKKTVRKVALDALVTGEVDVSTVSNNLPIDLLSDFIKSSSPGELSGEQLDSFRQMSVERWTELLAENHVDYDFISGELNFDDAISLSTFFEELPEDYRNKIIENSRRLVTI